MKARKIAAGVLFMIGLAATVFAVFLLVWGLPQQGPDTGETVFSIENFDGWVPPEPAAATPTPEPQANTSAFVKLAVPRIGVDAPITVMGVRPDGAMQDPPGPKTVAWYNFSGRPGAKGNIVMAGHVDYVNYGPAVFWRLRDLKEGDDIQVYLEDGSVYHYQVVSLTYYDADDAPIAEIVGPTPYEAITLITCGGSFDRSVREYDKRLIVRGARVPDAALAPSR